MPRASVLIATAPDARQRLARILDGWDVSLASSCEEVVRQLAAREFERVILGTHFAESSVFTVLEGLPRERRRRVVCVQALPFSHGLGKSTFAAFRSACLALGASLVLDLTEFPDNAAGDARVRELLQLEVAS